MKPSARIILFLFSAGAFFISGCRKEPEPVQYDLTNEELQWLPYDVVGFQPFWMKDETGYVHHLNLHVEETRDMGYWGSPGGNNKLYYERNYNRIHFGRHFCDAILRKDVNGLELSFYAQHTYGHIFSNSQMNSPQDSVLVHGRTFYNVIVSELDTTGVDSIGMWRIYVVKNLGVVGADFRGGMYYVME